jgi:hypothetical protein
MTRRPSGAAPFAVLPPPAVAALLLGMLVACTDSATDPQDEADLTASMTGERETAFQGTAVFRLVDGVFEMHGGGEGIFEGHEMHFTATDEGMLEPGTYTVGLASDENGPDLVVAWRMAVAIFTSTEGTFTVSSASEDEIRGEFTFDAVRTHVCSSFGFCETLGGEQPVNQVEGAFRAAWDEG